MEGPLQWHPGNDESADHAHQLRQLALDRALPPATALSEVACRCDIAAPDKEWDKDKCAHQADDAQLDAVDLIGIHAGLDQIDRVEARRTKMQPAPPQNCNGAQPVLVPSRPPFLMLPPLDWRERRSPDQFDRR